MIAFVLVVLVDALASLSTPLPAAPHRLVSVLAGVVAIVHRYRRRFSCWRRAAVQTVQQGPASWLASKKSPRPEPGRSGLPSCPPKSLVGEVKRAAGRELPAFGSPGGWRHGHPDCDLLRFMFGGQKRISEKLDLICRSSHGAGLPNIIVKHVAGDIRTYLWVQTVTGAESPLRPGGDACGRLNNVLFWAVIFFRFSFIPNIGTTVGSIVPALFALRNFALHGRPRDFRGHSAGRVHCRQHDYPRMQAETQNIVAVVVILSLSFWTVLWGISGAFLAVPRPSC